MADFTAVIECDMFEYAVKAYIDEMGVIVYDIYFSEEPLTQGQLIHFIKVYGEADLDDEVMRQYDEWVEDQRQDNLIESLEIRQLERRVA